MTKYKWKVRYKDGTDCTADDTGYGEIDRPNVESVSIVDESDTDVYSVSLSDEESFAYRRRVKQTFGGSIQVCHILLKYTKQGNKFAFVFEDGSPTHIRDNFIANHKWFYSPVVKNFETL